MNGNLTIGRLAASAQVGVETVRYYQRRGLLREPSRSPGSVRRYSDDDARRIRFIRRAQQLDFTLDEVAHLLALEDGRSCRETERLAQEKLDRVEARIADLERLRKTLRELIGRCDSGGGRISCPIIASLAAEA
ncbi:MAG: Hg(II)-responsive transcriptional regulator [Proteobacteria bacterium]|jgi:MerR family mercuric resistance operon transcriptional regulator|nr:Hg(II)-responsive transcriptional regulator [Pseudomonadota bacterium]